MAEAPESFVVAVAAHPQHRFSKTVADEIALVEGMGVEGDAHFGATVQHLSRKRRTPDAPNLRQVHLIHAELLDALDDRGYAVSPGELGENILTRGVDLLTLPTGTLLHLGQATVEVTGLRNPCVQIDRFEHGLMSELVHRDENGDTVREAGVMAVVVRGGIVRTGDAIVVQTPAEPHTELVPV